MSEQAEEHTSNKEPSNQKSHKNPVSILSEVPWLEECEELIRSKFESDSELLTEISSYLLELGGKRIRPVLCFLVAKLLGMQKASQEILDIAAGIELIHMATLLHDDIIDRSLLRRHKESAFKRFGPENTLIAGDFLLVRAFGICSGLDDFIVRETEKACVELTEGEILETPLNREKHSLKSWETIAQKKTASLFRLAALSAAHIATSGDSEIEKTFAYFGEQLGLAFQALDDVLDITSTVETLGKPPGIDLREQKPSLVNVLWLQSGDPFASEVLCACSSPSDNQVQEALSNLKNGKKTYTETQNGNKSDTAVIEIARNHASKYAENAKNSLLKIAEEKQLEEQSLQTLLQLIEFTVQRLK